MAHAVFSAFVLFLLLFPACRAFGQGLTTTGGLNFLGADPLPVSEANTAVIYYDRDTNSVLCSAEGGTYATVCDEAGGGGGCDKIDCGTTPQIFVPSHASMQALFPCIQPPFDYYPSGIAPLDGGRLFVWGTGNELGPQPVISLLGMGAEPRLNMIYMPFDNNNCTTMQTPANTPLTPLEFFVTDENGDASILAGVTFVAVEAGDSDGTTPGAELLGLGSGAPGDTVLNAVRITTPNGWVMLGGYNAPEEALMAPLYVGRTAEVNPLDSKYEPGIIAQAKWPATKPDPTPHPTPPGKAGAATIYPTEDGCLFFNPNNGSAPVNVACGTTDPPTIDSCGTDPALVGTDRAGRITVGSGAITDCVIEFGGTYSPALACIAQNSTTLMTVATATDGTTMTVTSIVVMDGDTLTYICAPVD